MNCNKLVLVLSLSCAAVSAQDQPAPPALPAFPVVTNNREEMLQRALRAAVAKDTNFAARLGTNAADATSSRTPLPAPAPRPGGIVVPSGPGTGPGIAFPSGARTNAVGAETSTNDLIAITPSGATANQPPEEVLPPGVINFPATDLNQVLQIYAELVGRTVLRPAALPAQTITLKTQTPLTKSEAIRAFDTVLGMNGIVMINVDDKFVKAVPLAQAGQEGAPWNKREASQMPDFGQYVTHVVQLKYVKPTEMATVLQPFSKIPNAAIPIDASQILVLRDYTENVKRMLELIREVDVAVPSEFIQEVIPIKYALASEIASALNSLSSGGGGATVGGAGTGTTGGAAGSSRAGGRSFGSGFGGSTGGGMGGYNRGGYGGGYGGYSPMAMGGTPTPATPGGTFSDRLQQIIKRASASGDDIVVLGQTKIISDERTNSLLIFASRDDMKMIKEVVAKLDVVLAQVLIEAVIVEVTLGDTKEVGFSYLQRPQNSGNFTGVGAVRNTSFLSPENFVSGGTNSLEGGFSYFGRWGNDLDFTVRALATDSRAKILQRPRIQTSHAVEANLFVGESRPYPTASYYGGGSFGGYSSIQQVQIGVTLSVTPLINPDGLVVMDIHQTIESANGTVNIVNVGDVPITSRKEAMAKVAVRDRDTIILGGLIENSSSKSGSGVPYLMNIPLVGYLFRSNNARANRNELIVLIRPTVLPTPEVAALTATSERERMPGVRRAEAEVKADEARRLKQSQREESGGMFQ